MLYCQCVLGLNPVTIYSTLTDLLYDAHVTRVMMKYTGCFIKKRKTECLKSQQPAYRDCILK